MYREAYHSRGTQANKEMEEADTEHKSGLFCCVEKHIIAEVHRPIKKWKKHTQSTREDYSVV
jgi:hypothetical protein